MPVLFDKILLRSTIVKEEIDMKKSLADRIEEYLKVLIARSEEDKIEIQRAELAETFNCVPSQVTYVISTRFTIEEGYFTESRRGGKGFVRIVCMEDDKKRTAFANQNDLLAYIDRLHENRLINEKENRMLKHIINYSIKNMSFDQQDKYFKNFKQGLSDFIKV